MLNKKTFVFLLSIFLIMFLSCPAMAQMKRVNLFKGIEVPFNLKHKDSIFEKGKYDFEIQYNYRQQVFYLKLIKKGKALCLITGERLQYKSRGFDRFKDPDIPTQASLKIRRYPAGKIVNVIFESGKRTSIYPFVKVRFKMEYE